MRRQSLRPRQIDIHARMPIIRSQEDLVMDDDPSATQPTTTFEELVAHLDDQQQPAVQKLRRKKSIPIPVTLTVDSYADEVKADFSIPTSYVRFQNVPSTSGITVGITTSTAPHPDSGAIVSATAARGSSSSSSNNNSIPALEDIDDDAAFHGDEEDDEDLAAARRYPRVELDLELAEILWLKAHPRYGEDGDPRYQLSLATLARMLDCLERASALINPSVITLAEAEEVLAKQLGMRKTPLNRATVDVYNYWAQKRQQVKRPLLRKYWPQTPLNDTNPHLVFRPREKERYKLRKHRKNDMDGYRKLQQLRADFERVRHLLTLVAKRERAKRMEVEFLAETRRQAIHELTDRSGSVRKPRLQARDVDNMLRDTVGDRLNKKRKKKKNRHLGDEDGVDMGEAYGNGRRGGSAATNAGAMGGDGDGGQKGHSASASNVLPMAGQSSMTGASRSGKAPMRVVTRMPTFMDYQSDHTAIAKSTRAMLDEGDVNIQEPYYPSYPLPPAHLMAAVFSHPPKYRCRGRVGRGGRLIVDRIPAPGAKYYSPTEIPATGKAAFLATNQPGSVPGKATTSASAPAIAAPSTATPTGTPKASTPPAVIVTPPPPPMPSVSSDALNSGHHAAILVHEASFRPSNTKMDALTTARLHEIYAMSDSEDELMEPLTSAVYEPLTSRKSSSSSSGGKNSHAHPSRAVKFALDV